MNQFLDILLLASFVIGGVYSLWTAVQMRRWKELKPNKFIYPNGCEPGDCTNPEGFRAFMRPQVLPFWPPVPGHGGNLPGRDLSELLPG